MLKVKLTIHCVSLRALLSLPVSDFNSIPWIEIVLSPAEIM